PPGGVRADRARPSLRAARSTQPRLFPQVALSERPGRCTPRSVARAGRSPAARRAALSLASSRARRGVNDQSRGGWRRTSTIRRLHSAHLVRRLRPRFVVRMNSVWNLLTGTATKYLLLAINIVIGVFLMPYTVRHLGTSEYGLWMLVASMTAYFNLLDLGYGNGLVRHVADADARDNPTLVNQILSTFVVVYVVLGAVVAIAAGAMVL